MMMMIMVLRHIYPTNSANVIVYTHTVVHTVYDERYSVFIRVCVYVYETYAIILYGVYKYRLYTRLYTNTAAQLVVQQMTYS